MKRLIEIAFKDLIELKIFPLLLIGGLIVSSAFYVGDDYKPSKIVVDTGLKTGIQYNEEFFMWLYLAMNLKDYYNVFTRIYMFLYALSIGFLYASSVSAGLRKGHLKLLLTLPIRRWELLLSKYIVSLLVMLATVFVSFYIVSIVEYGFPGHLLLSKMFLRETILIATIAFTLAVTTQSEGLTIFITPIGFYFIDQIFISLVSDTAYQIYRSAEPFITLGIYQTLQSKIGDTPLAIGLLGDSNYIQVAYGIHTSYYIYTFLSIAFLLFITLNIFARRDLD